MATDVDKQDTPTTAPEVMKGCGRLTTHPFGSTGICGERGVFCNDCLSAEVARLSPFATDTPTTADLDSLRMKNWETNISGMELATSLAKRGVEIREDECVTGSLFFNDTIKLVVEFAALTKQLEQAERQRETYKNIIERGKHEFDSCVCRFEEDGETPVAECSIHAAMRSQLEQAHRDIDKYKGFCGL